MAIQAHLYLNNIEFPQTSQDWIPAKDCGAVGFPHSCFYPPQKQPPHYVNETQMHQNMSLDTNLPVSSSISNNDSPVNYLPSVPNFQSLALQFEKQSHEIDHYIKLQSEKLRMKLQEQRKQQVATILNQMELDMLYLMSQKDEEIARAVKKRMELEDLLNRLQAENQAWRRASLESEAMMLSLSNSLEKMKEKAHYSFNNELAEDAQSCCDESGGNYKVMEEGEAMGENVKEDHEQIMRDMTACRSCSSGMSCFLFLPCRHLCSCKACEPFLQACPVCRMPKKARIEALIF